MSMLMEALRKSEAQRKLGKTPTLDSPVASENMAAGNDRTWIPAVMALLTAGVIGWTGLKQFQRPESPTVLPVSVQATEPQETVPDQPAAVQTGRPRQSAKTPVMGFTAAKPSPGSDATAGTPVPNRSGGASQLPAKIPPVRSNRRSAVSVASTGESQDAASESQPPVEASGDPAESGSTRRQDRIEPTVPDSISYWQIPQSVRGDMPELRITVLVYSENPEDRFLLINGQRLHEKETLENGMVLDEIQRDRAIFNYRNYRFYLKN